MAVFKTYAMNNSTVLRINAERPIIDTNPDYQRNSEIWNLDKRQLLIDSLLNDYDIPKLYFHVLPPSQQTKSSQSFDYAIIDGKQRLEAIWRFIDGKFPLAEDFEFFKDPSVKAGNLTYPDLAKEYPKLKIIFDSAVLPIVCVDTDDLDLIEDMFSRLNEAVPLNAAEKRNAIGGPMAKVINQVSSHMFFKQRVSFSNKRYQHKEMSTKLLYIEHILIQPEGKITDIKKPWLDNFVKSYKTDKKLNADTIKSFVTRVLHKMASIFTIKDTLLRSQAIVPIYYLLMRTAMKAGKVHLITRSKLVKFHKDIKDNRLAAEQDITKANYDYLEFDRMSQQGTNDSISIRERLRIISKYFGIES